MIRIVWLTVVARLLCWAADITKTGDKMANLYKKALIQRDATGKRTPYKTEKWWGRYRDAHSVTQRIPLSENKQTAQRMLGEILSRVELEKSGMYKPQELEAKKSILAHMEDFLQHQKAKNNTPRYDFEVKNKLRRVIDDCQWRRVGDITAMSVERFLTSLRQNDGLSVTTGNHYLRTIKNFVHWLVESDRLVKSPLKSLKTLNSNMDRRHHRRALSQEEFNRLIEATRYGGPACGLSGADRAMLYILAAWTGFRRGELGSLTLRSFDLVSNPPIVRIQAAYSKRRREDVQFLHPDLVNALLEWFPKRFRDVLPAVNPMAMFQKLQRLSGVANTTLFEVSKSSCGVDRRTSKMMEHDLATARRKWVAEADSDDERTLREESDFLCYKNSEGRFADFHGLRHTFISNLCKAGVSPKTAQVLARHSTMELTMNVYTHIDQATQAAAIHSLPGLKSSL